MDGWIDGWMDGWMGRGVDGWIGGEKGHERTGTSFVSRTRATMHGRCRMHTRTPPHAPPYVYMYIYAYTHIYMYIWSRLIYILVYIYRERERAQDTRPAAPLPREAQAVKYAVGVTMAYSSLWRTRLWRLDYGVDHGVL